MAALVARLTVYLMSVTDVTGSDLSPGMIPSDCHHQQRELWAFDKGK